MKLYSRRKLCRFCGSRKLESLGVLGSFAAFAGEGPDVEGQPRAYPVEWFVCEACLHVQNTHVILPEHLYGESPYEARHIPGRAAMMDKTAAILKELPQFPATGTVIDVGANDGMLMERLGRAGLKVIGVDPSPVVERLPEQLRTSYVHDVFEARAASSIRREHGQVDAIVAIGMFSRIDNLHAFVSAVRYVLKDEGVLVFDMPYLSALYRQSRFDWISHEVLSFPTLVAIQQFFSLNLMKLVHIVAEAGLPEHLLCVARKKESKGSEQASVEAALQHDRKSIESQLKGVRDWVAKLPARRENIHGFLAKAKADVGTLAGIGLDHGSWNTLHAAGLGSDHLDYLLDDTPAFRESGSGGIGWPVHPLGEIGRLKPGGVVLLNPDLDASAALKGYKGKVITLFPDPAYAG